LAARPRRPELFLKTFQFIECRQQRPGLQRVVIIGIADQPHDSAAAADGGFELEDCFDCGRARALHGAGRGTGRVDRETCRPGAARIRVQLAQDRVRAADRLDVPAQRQHVAPMAVGMKQGFEQAVVGFCERAFELRQPVVRGNPDIVSPVQHLRSQGRPSARRFHEWQTYTVCDSAERPEQTRRSCERICVSASCQPPSSAEQQSFNSGRDR
jgi:hypothetical protein